MTRRWLSLLFLPLLGAAPARSVPQRIVSLNLCADQYLIALADPGQIAALTRLSRDSDMSAAALQAAHLPVTKGGAEDVLALRPDLLVAPPPRITAALGRGIATLDLPPANTYADIVAQTRTVAAAIGQVRRGETLIRSMDARLAALPRGAGRGRVAAYYQRRGYLTGTGTLVDDLMRRIGLTNLAARLNEPALARLSLERLALARPDYLIVESASDRVRDQGTELLHHPLIARIQRLRVPEAWTVCGGPAYVLAAETLAQQVQARR